ncbi:MAG: DUF4493 domain-containing protein [Alistipes sp.]|nr:DUF4493 domain-containing protein [Alistipes sp.]
MKRFLSLILLASAMMTSCGKDSFNYGGEEQVKFGTLSFAGELTIDENVEVVTRAGEVDNYSILVYNSEDVLCLDTTYGAILNNSQGEVLLPEGTYTVVAQSAKNVPAAAFETPIYGVTKENIEIKAGEITPIGELVCKLVQCKVSVAYNDDFIDMIAGNCTTIVTIGGELEFPVTFDNLTGKVSYKKENGFFEVNNGENTTMEVKFSGIMDVDGEKKTQRMTKAFENIQPATWRQITFVKKVDEEGNATFDIEISNYVEDSTLGEDIEGSEETIDSDPNAPQGDGGIELISTCAFDISQPIVIPAMSDPTDASTMNMVLTMQANVPNGVRKFIVTISSDNSAFVGALDLVGGPVVDLVNPSEAAMGIFDIVPFPHGSELIGMTQVDFDLSKAQQPILGFPGNHTFVMSVVDQKGCSKDVTIVMNVPDYASQN